MELLLNRNDEDFPDVAVVVTDVENLKRNLLLFTQIKGLKIPVILVINMSDRMSKKGISIDVEVLEKKLDTKIALVSTRKSQGIERIKDLIANHSSLSNRPNIDVARIAPDYFAGLQRTFPNENPYKLWLVITQDVNFTPIEKERAKDTSSFPTKSKGELKKLQHRETVLRYQFINGILKDTYKVDLKMAKGLQANFDKIVTHRIFGYLIFIAILMLIFQVIFEWSTYPSDFIDEQFALASEWLKNTFPPGILTGSFGGRNFSRYWRHCGFYSANRLSVLIHCHFGRIGIYEPGGILDGSVDASLWVKWKKRSTLNVRSGLCYSCRDGNPHN